MLEILGMPSSPVLARQLSMLILPHQLQLASSLSTATTVVVPFQMNITTAALVMMATLISASTALITVFFVVARITG